jgi:electron transfer flavoprotein alpha subunit
MSEIKRIDPRRPFRITPEGLRRIVLGEKGWAKQPAASIQHATKPKAKPLRLAKTPERWFIAIVHSDRGRLDEHARQTLAAAAILATPETGVMAVVLGELCEDLGALGADRVAVFPDLVNTIYQPERKLAVVKALIAHIGAAHVFLPDDLEATGDLGRRLIAAHADSAATHVVEISADHVAVRWSGGAALASAPLPRFVLLEAGAVDVALPFAGRGELLSVQDLPEIPEATAACRDLGIEEQDSSAIPLEEADFIVAAGNGVRNVETINALARTLGAAVGASRVAVDDGRFPREKQIGATGKTVAASAYVAVGISGAVQHLQGIKDCRYVIAINRDVGAPIVKRADLTLVGDAEELMQALLTRISQAREQREMPEAP